MPSAEVDARPELSPNQGTEKIGRSPLDVLSRLATALHIPPILRAFSARYGTALPPARRAACGMFSARNGAVAGVGVGGTPANGGAETARLITCESGEGASVYEAIARPLGGLGSDRRFSKPSAEGISRIYRKPEQGRTKASNCRQSVKPALRSEKPGAVVGAVRAELLSEPLYAMQGLSPSRNRSRLYSMQALTPQFQPANAGLAENAADGFSVEKRPRPGREIIE